jgi:hypothetical protein
MSFAAGPAGREFFVAAGILPAVSGGFQPPGALVYKRAFSSLIAKVKFQACPA